MNPFRYFYAYMIAATLVALVGLGMAGMEQSRLYWRVQQCQLANSGSCEVRVVPVEVDRG